jgi:hypothetical protein
LVGIYSNSEPKFTIGEGIQRVSWSIINDNSSLAGLSGSYCPAPVHILNINVIVSLPQTFVSANCPHPKDPSLRLSALLIEIKQGLKPTCGWHAETVTSGWNICMSGKFRSITLPM